ncbi:MAG: hypothetical protein C4521_03965 [Actinobacteria bacterium]|nr:MAG: hypothetical protein C4521_03965 [Actinomycetota bacterium]
MTGGHANACRGKRIAALLGLLLLCGLLLPLRAFAAPPSTIEETGSAFGRSAWTYRDIRDADFKYEGGYARFDDTSTLTYANPHGGYDTATNKCKVCHASHRAQGSYFLMRADSENDACSYCHIGGSAHSSTTVYDGNEEGMATSVGHTIGAAGVIPASSVDQTMSAQELQSTDASGNVTTETVQVRTAEAGANKIFRLRRTHGQTAAGDLYLGYERVGPTSLTCMSCHQPHNAPAQLWRPAAFPDESTQIAGGYRLLRANPSGSLYGPDGMDYGGGGPETVSYTTDGMIGYGSYTNFSTTGLVNADNTIRAPESTLTAGVTYGYSKTIWASPPYPYETSSSPGPTSDPGTVNQYALSVWCADCHNLAIGYFKNGDAADLDLSSHETSRTHPAPFAGANNGPAQCYTCHRAELSPAPSTAAYDSDPAALECEKCHYGTGSFAADPRRAGSLSDFPHSAETSGTKMLGAWTIDSSGTVQPEQITEANTRDVCLRCHRESGKTHE